MYLQPTKPLPYNFIARTDGDGNNYLIVQIGTTKGTTDNLNPSADKGVQTWMAENLKTTKYRNGDPITNITDPAIWGNLTTGAYCDQSNIRDNSVIYGKLKETGTTHWLSPNVGATNETGFTVLPGGYRNYYGPFSSIGSCAYFWSSTGYNTNHAWYRAILHEYSNVNSNYYYKKSGHSVRCLKD